MGNITITQTDGGLGIIAPNQDHISGFISFNNSIPNWLELTEWLTATAYIVGDIRYIATQKNYYTCNTSHTSTDWATDEADWTIYRQTVKRFKSIADVIRAGIAKDSVDWTDEYYVLSEYFRLNPAGDIYTFIAPVPTGTYDYNELVELQTQANGLVRQFGILAKAVTFASTELTAVQSKLDYLKTKYRPAIAIYTSNFITFTDISTLPDLSILSTDAYEVAVVIGSDGAGYGSTLNLNTGDVGAVLGVTSLAKVSHSIAWVDAFNMSANSTTDELDTPALANGQLFSRLTDAEQTSLNEKHYIYFITHEGKTGGFCETSSTAASATSDYHTIENNRVYNKVYREVYISLVGLLNSPLSVNPNGTMTSSTVSAFNVPVTDVLSRLVTLGNISGFTLNIDLSQNVIATGKVLIDIRLVPIESAKNINITLGYSVK